MIRLPRRACLVLLATLGLQVPAAADRPEHALEAQEFVHGAPADPSEAWTLAAGGRLYDNWWDALDKPEPKGTHPSYPASGKAEGKATWRCRECHGWDYKGRNGRYKDGSHATGIIGVDGAAGRKVEDIAKLLRSPLHGYTPEMLTDVELARVAAFVSRGQHDVSEIVDAANKPKGDVTRGKELFQTICAACHGFDGRLLNWGTAEAPAYIGTEANKFPDEVAHKLRNSHPGAAMVNLRALPLSDTRDVLTYAATLPTK